MGRAASRLVTRLITYASARSASSWIRPFAVSVTERLLLLHRQVAVPAEAFPDQTVTGRHACIEAHWHIERVNHGEGSMSPKKPKESMPRVTMRDLIRRSDASVAVPERARK